ncbi:MAG: cytochrome c [Deltaproteobacteria bacterium]|nr:cytochrome c [Deltaproteobacteria bacterium]
MFKKSLILLSLVALVPVAAHAADIEKGKVAFGIRCASCHGPEGHGDGPVGKALPPGTVRNLSTGPFKYATDAAKTKELLQKGGAALGLNALMPAQPDASDQELDNMVAYVMSLRK